MWCRRRRRFEDRKYKLKKRKEKDEERSSHRGIEEERREGREGREERTSRIVDRDARVFRGRETKQKKR
jgi:hypothetical protein